MAMSGFEKLFVNREGKGRRNAARVEQRLAELEAGSIRDVLEIGCGIGTVSAYLAETHGMNVVGTDFDAAQIEKARELYPQNDQLRFQVEDAAALSFPAGSFDLVIAHNMFHHIPAWETAFSEVHRVLRPGGRLMWLDLVFVKPVRALLSAVARDESFFSLEEVVGAFGRAGFEEQFHERSQLLLFTQHHFVLGRA